MTDNEIITALAEKVMDPLGPVEDHPMGGVTWLGLAQGLWNPLEKIADAWMLIEKVTPDKTVTIHQILMDDNAIDWRVDVDDDENQFTVVVSGENKAPRAISLAIAKAR